MGELSFAKAPAKICLEVFVHNPNPSQVKRLNHPPHIAHSLIRSCLELLICVFYGSTDQHSSSMSTLQLCSFPTDPANTGPSQLPLSDHSREFLVLCCYQLTHLHGTLTVAPVSFLDREPALFLSVTQQKSVSLSFPTVFQCMRSAPHGPMWSFTACYSQFHFFCVPQKFLNSLQAMLHHSVTSL